MQCQGHYERRQQGLLLLQGLSQEGQVVEVGVQRWAAAGTLALQALGGHEQRQGQHHLWLSRALGEQEEQHLVR